MYQDSAVTSGVIRPEQAFNVELGMAVPTGIRFPAAANHKARLRLPKFSLSCCDARVSHYDSHMTFITRNRELAFPLI